MILTKNILNDENQKNISKKGNEFYEDILSKIFDNVQNCIYLIDSLEIITENFKENKNLFEEKNQLFLTIQTEDFTTKCTENIEENVENYNRNIKSKIS